MPRVQTICETHSNRLRSEQCGLTTRPAETSNHLINMTNQKTMKMSRPCKASVRRSKGEKKGKTDIIIHSTSSIDIQDSNRVAGWRTLRCNNRMSITIAKAPLPFIALKVNQNFQCQPHPLLPSLRSSSRLGNLKAQLIHHRTLRFNKTNPTTREH